MFRPNTLFYSDGYKVGHKKMLAPGTDFLYGTWIPRSLKYAYKGAEKAVSMGQQLTVRWLHDEFEENFFGIDEEKAMLFGRDMSLYLGLPYDAEHFRALHQLGYLPLKIKALPEGIETKPNIPHMTFINTVSGFAWLTLYLETIISSLSWKTATSATLALKYRRQAAEWILKTDPENIWLLDFICHDFSARGLDPFSMLASGLGHASSFRGSDTLIVIPGARYYYDEPEDEVCINSVNASEHSVSTTKIFTCGERQMIIDWLKEFPTGILSIVADTFDLWKLLLEYVADPEVKELVLAREGKLVIRPDSGDPVDITCGKNTNIENLSSSVPADTDVTTLKDLFEDILLDEVREDTPHGEHGVTEYENKYMIHGEVYNAKINNIEWNRHDKQYYFIEMFSTPDIEITKVESSPIDKGVIQILWDIYGGTTNESGYRVLDPHIGAIYGDSITIDRQLDIYTRLAVNNFASTNIVLGIGSFTYQMNTRDTMGFAAKGAWFECNGKGYDIYKDPITDDGTKKSLKGLCAVIEEDFEYVVKTECTKDEEESGVLDVIYNEGQFPTKITLTEIREKLAKLSA